MQNMIELKLKQYHQSAAQKIEDQYYEDIKQFIAYWKKNPNEGDLFSEYKFLMSFSSDNTIFWHKPSELCLDLPYRETGLSSVIDIHNRQPIACTYQQKLIAERDSFIDFLSKIGVMVGLTIEETNKRNNPHHHELCRDQRRRTSINEDYTIQGLDQYISKKSIPLSLLIWNALIQANESVTEACFRPPNKQYELQYKVSQLIHTLKNKAWLPDKEDDWKKPADMTHEDLHHSFVYPSNNKLLDAIDFGKNTKIQNDAYQQKNNQAQNIELNDAEEAEEAKKLLDSMKKNNISVDEKNSLQQKEKSEFPEPVSNTERRQERKKEDYLFSPDKQYEKCLINNRITNNDTDTLAWLREQYTNEHDEMFCQICQKPMPFRKKDGNHYFEKREILSREYLPKEDVSQHIALCPICAAKFNEFIKGDEDATNELKQAILNYDIKDKNNQIPIKLGKENITIRFTKPHITDVRIIVRTILEQAIMKQHNTQENV